MFCKPFHTYENTARPHTPEDTAHAGGERRNHSFTRRASTPTRGAPDGGARGASREEPARVPSPPRRTHIALFPDAVTATENRISFCQFPSAGRRAGQLRPPYFALVLAAIAQYAPIGPTMIRTMIYRAVSITPERTAIEPASSASAARLRILRHHPDQPRGQLPLPGLAHVPAAQRQPRRPSGLRPARSHA